MSERTQQPVVNVAVTGQPDERVSASAVLSLDRFRVLLDSLPSTAADEREAVAGKIINLLIAMRDRGNDAAEAAAILKELDLQTLSTVVDGQGRNARKEAVETLMVMGFPHALKISPEDFAWARDVVSGHSPKARGMRRAVIYGLFLASAIGLLLAGVSSNFPVAVSGLLVGLAALMLTAAVIFQNQGSKT